MVSPLLLLAAASTATAAPATEPGRPPLDVSLAQLVIAPPTPPPLPISEDVLALGASQDRMTVPVSIAQRGPWNFIIDTGSERTVVSRELAGVLGLSAGRQVRVIAMTGPEVVGSVIVPSLSVSQISRETIEAPALNARDMGAAGMLGLDALQDHAITLDFAKSRMTLKPSRKRSSPRFTPIAGEVVVSAKSLFGQLIVTDAFWHGRRISVIVDTGSPVTVGNGALLAAITARSKPLGPLEVTSATGDVLHTTAFSVDQIEIGGIGFNNVRVAFSDVPPFKRFGLGDSPALLLGMDSLRLFRRVGIDFANREIRFGLSGSVGNATVNDPNRPAL